LVADYALTDTVNKLFVRFGLSPDLDSLLVQGQAGLSIGPFGGGVEVKNVGTALSASARIGLDSNGSWQVAATDDDSGNQDTVPMRNQSMVQQVEVKSDAAAFTVSLELGVVVIDGDEDGLPTVWEAANDLDDDDSIGDNGASGDPDEDGFDNRTEWLLGMNPQIDDRSAYPRIAIDRDGDGAQLDFPTIPDRNYQWEISDDLDGWEDHGAPLSTVGASGPGVVSLDELISEALRFYRVRVSGP
jgi:hypothetical protein